MNIMDSMKKIGMLSQKKQIVLLLLSNCIIMLLGYFLFISPSRQEFIYFKNQQNILKIDLYKKLQQNIDTKHLIQYINNLIDHNKNQINAIQDKLTSEQLISVITHLIKINYLNLIKINPSDKKKKANIKKLKLNILKIDLTCSGNFSNFIHFLIDLQKAIFSIRISYLMIKQKNNLLGIQLKLEYYHY